MTKSNVHPALDKKDSVVVNLRTVPAALHRALRIAAMDDGVSLELFIVSTLTEAMQNRGRVNRGGSK